MMRVIVTNEATEDYKASKGKTTCSKSVLERLSTVLRHICL